MAMGVPKSKAEYVAQRLLDRIVTSNMGPGSSFGTEADILAQYDVSRPTLRESLRILESQGVLELRPGPKGGIMVAKPGTDILAHGLSVYLRMHEVPFIAVLKAREVIEPALAAEAAVNGTDADFDALQASIDRMKTLRDQSDFIEENRQFHSLVARASGNHVMEIFWSTISIVASGEEQGIQYTAANQKHVIEAHQQILDALRARDSQTASQRMDAHVRDLEQLVRKSYKYLLNQATSIVSRQGRQVG
ncbi:FadR/GntR family transcriptional regulator [Salipiger sp.]|uniref:FadR/GntR family transcriptional regulator n=1 Tax=Salipiger sp. TaxID=2078585 RepID=UPI003A97D30A